MKLPSYASVVATLALFVALGGTGYAAATLPRSSVGTEQLRDRSVTAAKLASGAAAPIAWAHISVASGAASVCGPHCDLATLDQSLSYGVTGVVFGGLLGPAGHAVKVFCVYGNFKPQTVAATADLGDFQQSPQVPQVAIGQAWMIQRCPQTSAGRVVAVLALDANAPLRLPSAVGVSRRSHPAAPPRKNVPGVDSPTQQTGVWLVFS